MDEVESTMGSDTRRNRPSSQRPWLPAKNPSKSTHAASAARCGSDPAALNDTTIGQQAARRRQGILAVLAIFLFYGGVVSAPHWWGQADGSTSRSRTTFRQCASVKEDAGRLACYDQAHREQLSQSARDARAMTFAELLMGLRHDSVRAVPVTDR
jgi:hypothetical protein